jgi:hypothetical protein
MKIFQLLLAFPLALAVDTAVATRVVEQVERAVELTLDQLKLPTADGGTISFRECEECPIKTHVLTDTTVFSANRQIVGLQDLLRVADEIRDKPNGAKQAMAVVFLDLKTERITRIEVRE